MKVKTILLLLLVLIGRLFPESVQPVVAAEKDAPLYTKSSLNDDTLRNFFRKYPDSDSDEDGILMEFEYRHYLPKNALKGMTDGTHHEHYMVPMRDGVNMATEVFLPDGEGPWPVILMRPAYGRWNAAGYAKRYKDEKFVFIMQDLRGKGDSEGSSVGDFPDRYGFGSESFEIDLDDGYDTLEWIAAQPWSNGRVGMIGGSGRGVGSVMALWSGSSNLTVCAPGNTGGNGMLYWLFEEGGVAKWSYASWAKHRIYRAKEWPKPNTRTFDVQKWRDFIATRVPDNTSWYMDNTGWFDPLCNSALDNFAALQESGRAFVIVAARGHGGLSGLKYPSVSVRKDSYFPVMTDLLNGKEPANSTSTLLYYLMGDADSTNSVANQWRISNVWPVPNTPIALNLHADGTLSSKAPATASTREWQYDPRNPAPSLGGHYQWRGDVSGPHDQRPLHERNDVLHFVSELLEEPVAITGKIKANLFVETDVPDTTYVVKLVDVYPDGYEAIIREGAAMLRYRDGWEQTAPPAEKDTVYSMEVTLGSTAQVFEKGHRIAVIVTSSSKPAYEVHPNSYEPVHSFDNSPIASNQLHLSAKYPSQIILPVVDIQTGKIK